MTTIRYKITVEYRGTAYAGWQRQSDVPSIQQSIEEAIHGFSGQEVTIAVAGRTDAGVHARGQIFHVDLGALSKPMDGYAITKAINAHLRPAPITILNVEQTRDDFHARFDATNKLYQYRILNRPAVPALERGLIWHIGKPLNVEKMMAGAKHLLGHHDFTTFRDSECQAQSPLKTLDRLEIRDKPYDTCGGKEIIIEAEGKSFLHHQVRNMVGTLSLVGLEKWTPPDIKTALEKRDRTQGGPTAPAEGLYLMRVDY